MALTMSYVIMRPLTSAQLACADSSEHSKGEMAATPRYIFMAAILSLSCLCQCEGQAGGLTLIPLTEPVDHGEGPHWDSSDNVLYYVDLTGDTVHRYDPVTKQDHHITLDKLVSLVLPIQGQKFKFVISYGLDLVVLTWDWESGFNSTALLVSVEDSPAYSFNDGKADSMGRIWAGTMDNQTDTWLEMNKSTLYRVDNNLPEPCQADPMVSPVTISNGIAWSADDKTMYYIDTPTRRVDAFDYDLTSGNLSDRRTVFEFDELEGNPDGMTIDNDDNLWIACYGGSQVIKVNPSTGKLLRQIKFPAELITSVVFGGPNLNTLFVTSARLGLSPEQLDQQPLAGTVWQVTGLNTTGTPSKPAVVNCKCNQ